MPDTARQLNVNLAADLIRECKHAAIDMDQSLSTFVSRALVSHLAALGVAAKDENCRRTKATPESGAVENEGGVMRVPRRDRRPRRRPWAIAVAILVAVPLAAGIGQAAIPDAQGEITVCYKHYTGHMRLIDTESVPACASDETELSWNSQGQPGTQGPGGGQGPPAVKLFATVDENSAVVRSSGRVTINRQLAGLYRLTFPQNVSDCTPVASVGITTAGSNLQAGEASAGIGPVGPAVVSVATFRGRAFTDMPFQVIVACP